MKKIFFFLLVVLIGSCTASKHAARQLNDMDRQLADSMLAYGLDHEAIYTLLDTLKPISSIKFLRYRIAADSNTPEGAEHIIRLQGMPDTLKAYQRICSALSTGDWQFVLNPFARTDDGYRSIEIYVVRKSRFKSILQQKQHFFGQWGFTPDADPATVLPVIEYEKKYDRYRAYGYLFGYPDYAVDFFVNASITSDRDTTIKLVPRDFFAIPVWAGDKGYFTYAMPKGHTPGETDSVIYRKSLDVLNKYRQERGKYVNNKGEMNALELWRRWNRKNIR